LSRLDIYEVVFISLVLTTPWVSVEDGRVHSGFFDDESP